MYICVEMFKLYNSYKYVYNWMIINKINLIKIEQTKQTEVFSFTVNILFVQ